MKKTASGRRGKICIFLTVVLSLFCTDILCAGESSITLFDELIAFSARKNHLDPLLVKAIIWRESKFKPRSVGSAGEIGLMQIRMTVVQDWAKEHRCTVPTKEELFAPLMNIAIGTWHFARCLEQWENHPNKCELALAQYNIGRTGLSRLLKKNGKNASLNLRYVNTILEKHREYLADVVQEPLPEASENLLVVSE